MNSVLVRSTHIVLQSPIRKCFISNFSQHAIAVSKLVSSTCYSTFQTNTLIKPDIVTYNQFRFAVSGFFNKHSADEIWKGVSSVSNAGRRRGRGKTRGKRVIKDLNRGQIIGIGKANIRFPGLSAPIIRGREIVKQTQLPPDENYEENLLKFRKTIGKKKRERVAPIDRGWTGGNPAGRKIGPPDPADKFVGFESAILEQRSCFVMTSHFGRYRIVTCVCGTGNGNGLFGYALGRGGTEVRSLIRRTKNRAAKKLMYIERHENRTIIHNFASNFGRTRLFAMKAARGAGLKCHRLIKTICELVGIKDIYVKVEGSMNTISIMNAFLLGLLRQKTFQELADETNLHVVELSQMNDYFPKLLASPAHPIESSDETVDFDLYCFDNKVLVQKRKFAPFYTKHRTWPITLRKRENFRGHEESRRALMVEYGEMRSFLTDQFPECKPDLPPFSRIMREKKKAEMESSQTTEIV